MDDIYRQLRRTSACPDTDRRRHVDLEWPQTCSDSSFGKLPPRFVAASTAYGLLYLWEKTDKTENQSGVNCLRSIGVCTKCMC